MPRLVGLLVSALLLIATGCGGSSDSTEPLDASTSTSQVVAEASTTTAPVSSSTDTDPTTSTTGAGSRTTEIRFPSGDIELVGDLRIPARAGPHPAVVIVHGSGPIGRDGNVPGQLNMTFGFELPVHAQIADALQDAGFAVLTYDKRTCGPFNGCSTNGYALPSQDLTVDAFIDDARAAVAALRARPEIDPARVAIAGHSQAGAFVPVLLVEDGSLAAGVMLAGNHSPIDAVIAFQLEQTLQLLETSGVTRDEAASLPGVAGLEAELAALSELRAGNTDVALSGGATPGFWLSWFALAWQAELDAAGVAVELSTPACVTHALNCVAQPDPTLIEPSDIGRTVSDDVLVTIVEFLQRSA